MSGMRGFLFLGVSPWGLVALPFLGTLRRKGGLIYGRVYPCLATGGTAKALSRAPIGLGPGERYHNGGLALWRWGFREGHHHGTRGGEN